MFQDCLKRERTLSYAVGLCVKTNSTLVSSEIHLQPK